MYLMCPSQAALEKIQAQLTSTQDNWDVTPAAPAAGADDSWNTTSNGNYSGGDARMMGSGGPSGSGAAGGGSGCRK